MGKQGVELFVSSSWRSLLFGYSGWCEMVHVPKVLLLAFLSSYTMMILPLMLSMYIYVRET